MSTISFNSAIHWQKVHKEEVKVNREELIQEIKETHLEGLDARDINYYANEVNLHPNKVRRMMIPEEDPQQQFMNEIESFRDDETDSIFEFY